MARRGRAARIPRGSGGSARPRRKVLRPPPPNGAAPIPAALVRILVEVQHAAAQQALQRHAIARGEGRRGWRMGGKGAAISQRYGDKLHGARASGLRQGNVAAHARVIAHPLVPRGQQENASAAGRARGSEEGANGGEGKGTVGGKG